ncbi:ATP-dependent DNA helicase RecQ-like [Asterias amurensis]|uniref:ATP-dependent DNA helicase RecQ-like n=1 Tax=Asterias amurensis TaxID=7602 RepID=UPI003AB5D419
MAASVKLSETDIFQAKEHACSRLGLNALKKQQSEALDAYLRGHDVFICLPTGFGKSVVFQAAPMCWDFLQGNNVVADDSNIPKSLAIVVVPLKSLAMNQLERCQAIGLEAAIAIAEISDEVLECAGQGKYSVLFASPEALLSVKGTELLQLQSVYSRVCGLFIDESHCVTKWGQSAGKTAAFRKLYGNIGQLRSRLQMDTPLIAMTATASSTVRKAVADSLSLKNVFLIHTSPILHNMKHTVLKTKSIQPKDVLGWLCLKISEKGVNTGRVIVYCQSRKTCSELYSMFKCHVPADGHVYFNMYHTNTQPEVQEDILKSFSDPNGTVRVLFATIAFGLGVDIKGLRQLISMITFS